MDEISRSTFYISFCLIQRDNEEKKVPYAKKNEQA